MPVWHLTEAARFAGFLERGGNHLFEITSDEMPDLVRMPELDKGLCLACVRSRRFFRRTAWMTLIDAMADHGAVCFYKQTGDDSYKVLCSIGVIEETSTVTATTASAIP